MTRVFGFFADVFDLSAISPKLVLIYWIAFANKVSDFYGPVKWNPNFANDWEEEETSFYGFLLVS